MTFNAFHHPDSPFYSPLLIILSSTSEGFRGELLLSFPMLSGSKVIRMQSATPVSVSRVSGQSSIDRAGMKTFYLFLHFATMFGEGWLLGGWLFHL